MINIIKPTQIPNHKVYVGWFVVGERSFTMKRWASLDGETVSVTHVTPYCEPPPFADANYVCLVEKPVVDRLDLVGATVKQGFYGKPKTIYTN